eukprot:6214357-Pleurochrysis_carterae.AAC.7
MLLDGHLLRLLDDNVPSFAGKVIEGRAVRRGGLTHSLHPCLSSENSCTMQSHFFRILACHIASQVAIGLHPCRRLSFLHEF